MEGIDKFNDIRNRYLEIKFFFVYYGLGKVYIIFNRYG